MSTESSDVERLLAQHTRFLRPILPYWRQRQLLGLLFRELALAARRSFTLDLVAESIADSPRIRPGAQYLHSTLLVLLVGFVAVLFSTGWIGTAVFAAIAGGFLLFAFCLAPHEDFIRHVAGRLADSMSQGRTLSEAMWGQRITFTSQERHVVIIGEQSGHLPESLEALAEYNMVSLELNRLSAAVLYPLAVLGVCLVPLTFIWGRIVPKYQTVFMQLGVGLPDFTVDMLASGPATVAAPLSFLLGPILAGVVIVLLISLIPRLLGGSVIATILFLVVFGILAVFVIFLPIAAAIAFSPAAGLASALAVFALAIVGGGAAAVGMYFLLIGISSILPREIGATAQRLLGWIGPVRQLEMSRFLRSLGFSLQAGIPAPEALEMAGHSVSGRLRADAIRFRAMIEQGQSFADCLKTSRRFRGQVAAILSLAEWRGSIADDCVELAAQLHARAERSSQRLAAAIEWPSIVLIGIIMGAFALACYLPLFNIPTAMLENMP